MGAVNRVVDEHDIERSTRETCAMIAANAPLTLRAAKQAMIEIEKAPDGFDAASSEKLVRECFESEDYKEGRRAFMEKRKPQFRGR